MTRRVSVVGSILLATALVLTALVALSHGPSVSKAASLSSTAVSLPSDAQMAATFGPVAPYTHLSALPANVVTKISKEEALSIAASNGPGNSVSATNPPTVVAATYSVDSKAPAIALSGGVVTGSRPVWLVQYHNVEQHAYGGHAISIAGRAAPAAPDTPDTFFGNFTVYIDSNTGEYLFAIGGGQ